MGIKNQHNLDNMERCPEVIVKDHEVRAMSCQGRQNKKSDRGSVARHDGHRRNFQDEGNRLSDHEPLLSNVLSYLVLELRS